MSTKLKVSLITTVYNEQEGVGRFLESLLLQTRLPDEIVIVDGGSTDGTADAIREFIPSSPVPIKLIVQKCNIAGGRNTAIRAASHDIVSVTDAGTIPEKDWHELIVAPLENDPSIDVVGGFYKPVLRNDFERSVYYSYVWARRFDEKNFLPSSRSIAFRKDVWEAVGGYPEWLMMGEDTHFDLAIIKAGFKMVFEGRAIVSWEFRKDLASTMRQFLNYSIGDGKAMQLFNEFYGAELARLFFRAACLAVGFMYPIAFLAVAVEWTLYTLRYRIARIFVSQETFSSKLKIAFVSFFISPIIDTTRQIGFLRGLAQRYFGNKRSA